MLIMLQTIINTILLSAINPKKTFGWKLDVLILIGDGNAGCDCIGGDEQQQTCNVNVIYIPHLKIQIFLKAYR